VIINATEVQALAATLATTPTATLLRAFLANASSELNVSAAGVAVNASSVVAYVPDVPLPSPSAPVRHAPAPASALSSSAAAAIGGGVAVAVVIMVAVVVGIRRVAGKKDAVKEVDGTSAPPPGPESPRLTLAQAIAHLPPTPSAAHAPDAPTFGEAEPPGVLPYEPRARYAPGGDGGDRGGGGGDRGGTHLGFDCVVAVPDREVLSRLASPGPPRTPTVLLPPPVPSAADLSPQERVQLVLDVLRTLRVLPAAGATSADLATAAAGGMTARSDTVSQFPPGGTPPPAAEDGELPPPGTPAEAARPSSGADSVLERTTRLSSAGGGGGGGTPVVAAPPPDSGRRPSLVIPGYSRTARTSMGDAVVAGASPVAPRDGSQFAHAAGQVLRPVGGAPPPSATAVALAAGMRPLALAGGPTTRMLAPVDRPAAYAARHALPLLPAPTAPAAGPAVVPWAPVSPPLAAPAAAPTPAAGGRVYTRRGIIPTSAAYAPAAAAPATLSPTVPPSAWEP